MMNKLLTEFINKLKDLAKFKFPVLETTKLLKEFPLLTNSLTPYLFFNEKHYTRNLIFQADEFELLALCWYPAQRSMAHGHEGQKCWTRVEKGYLKFNNYKDIRTNDYIELKIINESIGHEGFVEGPAYIHSVENNFLEPAVGLHLYAKPFDKCDIFVNNHVERVNLSYYSKFGEIVKKV